MSQRFKAIKARYKRFAIIVSAVLSACCALIACCALLAVLNLTGTEFLWAYYIPVGVGVAAAAFMPLYLIFRPKDKKLAKMLDESYGLEQKVQTMVEYEGDDSVMARLQREQAEEALVPVAKKRVRAEGLLKFIFVPILAIAMLFVGIFVPVKKSMQEEAPVEDPQDASYYHSRLEELIGDVRGSNLIEGLAVSICETLTLLNESFGETALPSEMKKSATATVLLIDGTVSGVNTYFGLGTELLKYPATRQLAYAVSDGANAYKSGAYRLSSMDAVKKKEDESQDAAADNMNSWIEKCMGSLDTAKNKEGEEKSQVQLAAEMLNDLSSRINASLSAFEENEHYKADGLYMDLRLLSSAVANVAASSSGYGEDEQSYKNYSAEVKRKLEENVNSFSANVATQSYNLMMNDYVRTRLGAIFNISLPEWETALKKITEAESGEGPGGADADGDGGWSSGGLEGGSGDLVFFPDADEENRVPYMQLLTDDTYMGGILEMIDTSASSSEMAAYIQRYFSSIISTQE